MTYTKYFLRAFIGAQAMFRRHSAAAADICRNLSGVFSRRLAVLLRHASVLASRGVFDSCRAPLLRARFAPLLCGEHFSSKSLSFALCVLLRVSSYLSILATYFFVRGNLHTQYPELVWGPAAKLAPRRGFPHSPATAAGELHASVESGNFWLYYRICHRQSQCLSRAAEAAAEACAALPQALQHCSAALQRALL